MQNYPNQTIDVALLGGESLVLLAKRYHTTMDAILLANPGLDLNQTYVGQIIKMPVNPVGLKSIGLPVIKINNEIFDLSNTLRGLQLEVVMYRRLASDEIFKQSEWIPLYVSRLEKSLVGLETVLSKYLAKDARKVRGYLEKMIKIYFDYVKASIADIEASFLENAWENVCDEASSYLASLNPQWDKTRWSRLFYDQMNLEKQEVKAIRRQDHVERITIIDKETLQSFQIADEFTNGIVKNFYSSLQQDKSK